MNIRFVTNKSDLLPVLKQLGGFIPAKPTHLILSNVLVQIKNNVVTFTAGDLSSFFQTSLEVSASINGSFTAPYKLLIDIVSKTIPDEDIEIECRLGEDQNANIKLTQNNSEFSLLGITAEEYPELPQLDKEGVSSVSISSAVLSECLTPILNCASNDDTKQILCGINFAADKEELRFAATDGHRLGYSRHPQGIGGVEELNLTIHNKFCREIVKLLDTQKTPIDIQIGFDEDLLQVEIGESKIIARRLSGSYPKYRDLIPAQFHKELVIDRKALISRVEQLSVLQSDKNALTEVLLDKDDELIKLTAKGDSGTAKSEVACQFISGESLELGFNYKYLLDGLKSFATTEIKLKANTSNTPVIFEPLGEQLLTYLIMPVTIRR